MTDAVPFSEDAVGESEIKSQTVTFLDGDAGVLIDRTYSTNPFAIVDDTKDISLGSFLARPTLIDTLTWSTSDVEGVFKTIKPWFLFLNNTVIKKKLDNFAYIRGNLHVKVVINATPFQYGLMRMDYEPLVGNVTSKIRQPRTSDVRTLFIPHSQLPGFFIQPAANSGGEIVLPFLYPRNFLDLTSANDCNNFGTLYYLIYDALKVASSGGSTSVTVRTYAWMEDVHLMGSTIKLALQGKDEYDDKDGAVSKPATAIASAAAMLSSIPVIGPFARATSIGASAVASIAQIFGYTNTPVIENIHGFQPMNAPMLASAHIGTPLQKLTLDPKQELSIDPAMHGISPHDELSLKSFIGKESYLTQFTWATSDAAGTTIGGMAISPDVCQTDSLINGTSTIVGYRFYETPLSYLSRCFFNWRGDIEIRLKVVCTKFHKGRLKISYDPVGNLSATNPDENVVYTEIFDIEDGADIKIKVPYHQDRGWMRCGRSLQEGWGISVPAPRFGTDNGTLKITVLNSLVAPASGANVAVMIFIKGGENFEFANPSDHIGNNSIAQGWTPSFFALQGKDEVDKVAREVQFGDNTINHPNRYDMNFGEPVGSLRNLLHRHQIVQTIPISTNTSNIYNTIVKQFNRMPTPNGYNPNAVTQAARIVGAGNTTYSYGNMPLLNYIATCFVAYRGSVNYALTVSPDAYGQVADIRVTRNQAPMTGAGDAWYGVRTLAGFTPTDSVKANYLNWTNNFYDGLAGTAINSTNTNSSLTFNFPDYNNYNFALADYPNYTFGYQADGTENQHVEFSMLLKNAAAATNTQSTITMQIAAGAGPDFTCLYFLCCPTTDYQIVAPTPV
ncbi:hypothetical protein 2 [Changjiang picorna-like virus 4]|uniref:hypothetical protein 2 n=1 Tax=Changjiang picorna-like virus 4 TaxID=1922793 RepID=UPI0009094993|nr:hypothetical protein 2 [Changjiang picorna-like virus 4]APG78995.1 hypothetical protein 2 [Changjiang picorna-like virus 4]